MFATKATLNNWTFSLCMAVSKKSITLIYTLEKIQILTTVQRIRGHLLLLLLLLSFFWLVLRLSFLLVISSDLLPYAYRSPDLQRRTPRTEARSRHSPGHHPRSCRRTGPPIQTWVCRHKWSRHPRDKRRANRVPPLPQRLAGTYPKQPPLLACPWEYGTSLCSM